MVERNYYDIYGLRVKSELKINEFECINNTTINNYDIEIRAGNITNRILKEITENSYFFAESNNFIFSINNTANYHVSNGNTVIIEPLIDIDEQSIKTFLLGTSFGMLLHQRGSVAVHGGTVVVNNKAVVITGESGAGKSTLVNGFRHRGFGFMADDVSVTGLDKNNNIVVKSAYPQQKVCKDTMLKMGYNLDDFKLIDEGREKYIVPVSETFRQEDLNLGAIFYITKDDIDKVKVEEVKGSEKLNIVMNNIYRIELIRTIGINKEYFLKCLDIAKKIPVFKITRPTNGFTIDEQMEKIEEIMERY